jgi:chromosome segregation protein
LYLSKLEIQGFKSFANKTQLNFNKGITGIVGPNGCGKTNIVDCIRWVLGEQKSSVLRSDKMENVIFNGTRNKKPMGMAEVSLSLVNDNGVLPTDYTEVTITRRIFRSGESEYLLNRNVCRLKDITSLFMDTGMATNAYSVIELKMVENILNKTDERRQMFEEAAGVNKFKLRRRLSLKKLDEVKADLMRVNDIVSEVEKNVRSLQRQAKRADKYNQLRSALSEKEIEFCEREFALFNRNQSVYSTENDELTNQKTEVDQSIRKIEMDLISLREIIRDVESQLSDKRLQINNESELLFETQKNLSVSEERIRSLNKNLERFKKDIEDLQNQLSESNKVIDSVNEQIIISTKNSEEQRIKIESNESVLSSKKKEVEENKNILKEKSNLSFEISKEFSQKESELKNKRNQIANINSELQKLDTLIQKATMNIAKSVGFLEELENEKRETKNKIEETDSLFLKKQEEKENLEKKLNELRQKEFEEKNVINSLRNKIELLQTMISNLEGVSKASRLLIENQSWSDKEKTLFADVGEPHNDYRFALEAALKSVLNNLLIDSIEDLQNAISYLKKNDYGKASFYLLKNAANENQSLIDKINILSVKLKKRKLQKQKGFINWAYNLVSTQPKWQPFFMKVLSTTAVVDSLDTAIKLQQVFSNFSFATPEGDLVHSSGIIDAGALPKLDETLFGRKQLLENLKSELPKLETKLYKLQNEISSTEIEINSIDLKSISEQGKVLLGEINSIEKQIAQLEFEKKKYSEEIDKAQNQIRQYASDANLIDKSIETLETQIAELKQKDIDAKETLAKFEAQLKHAENEFNELSKLQNNLRIDYERNLGLIKNYENDIKRIEQNKEKISTDISKRNSDIQITNDELAHLENELVELRKKLSELDIVRETLTNEESEIKSRLASLKANAGGLETNLNELRNQRQFLSDRSHELEIKISEIKMRLENLSNHIKEEYNSELTLKDFEDLDTFDFSSASKEVHELKQKIKELGPVNLLSYSEYEEENERLEFLLKQRDDLVNSEKDLIKTIEEINQTAEKLFLDTFVQIRENFKVIFRTLFDPGDEADLILQEGVDPLEAKIEITARPKGKRPTSIELLSGGEKTLTATALLFAIYLVKPSPFCILDEVDAPLDDANIERFTKLLKEFSNRTQFIIVTHNKRTMVAAENMYGVTMQEEGISKLAAVQFNDEIPVENE